MVSKVGSRGSARINETKVSEVGSRGSTQTRVAFTCTWLPPSDGFVCPRLTSSASSCGTTRSVSSSSADTQLPTPSAVSGTTRSPSPTDLPITPVGMHFGGSPRIPTSAVRDQVIFPSSPNTIWAEEEPAKLSQPKRKRLPRGSDVEAAASPVPRALNKKRSRL